MTRAKRSGVVAACAVLAALALTRQGGSREPVPDLATLAEQAYVYGYPLVLMDATRHAMTSVDVPGPGGAPINQFAHANSTPDASARTVVRPNLDTLYSSAWLDLQREPMVLHVPAVSDRFFLLQVLDAWTNVFAAPGTRTLQGEARDFAIVGPGWQGSLPRGLTRIDAPTNMAWIIGRTAIRGQADAAAARAVEVQYTLQPLSAWERRDPPPRSAPVALGTAGGTPPPAEVAALNGAAFFDRLAGLMRANPPAAADAPTVARFAALGLVPGKAFAPAPAAAQAIAAVPERALRRIQREGASLGSLRNGWRVPPPSMGAYGTDYDTRAAVAMTGLGANLSRDALYLSAADDGRERPLDGAHAYVVHFARGQTPPAAAFWSLTVYDERGYLTPNLANLHALGSHDPLAHNPDGSLDLYLQAMPPAQALRANWLPVPVSGRFNVMLRLYLPKAAASTGQWQPPPIERQNERSSARR